MTVHDIDPIDLEVLYPTTLPRWTHRWHANTATLTVATDEPVSARLYRIPTPLPREGSTR